MRRLKLRSITILRVFGWMLTTRKSVVRRFTNVWDSPAATLYVVEQQWRELFLLKQVLFVFNSLPFVMIFYCDLVELFINLFLRLAPLKWDFLILIVCRPVFKHLLRSLVVLRLPWIWRVIKLNMRLLRCRKRRICDFNNLFFIIAYNWSRFIFEWVFPDALPEYALFHLFLILHVLLLEY